MPAFLRGESQGSRKAGRRSICGGLSLPWTHLNLEKMILHRRNFGRGVEDVLSVVIDIGHVRVNLREACHTALIITQIEISVTVPVIRTIDKKFRSFEKINMVERLDKSGIILRQYGLYETSVRSLVHIEAQVLLSPVKNLDEDIFRIRRPADIGKIPVLPEIFNLADDVTRGREIIDMKFQILRIHAVHRVLRRHEASSPGVDIQQRKIRHLRLVFSVICKEPSVRGRVASFIDTELVPADALAADDLLAFRLVDRPFDKRRIHPVEAVTLGVDISSSEILIDEDSSGLGDRLLYLNL